MGTSVPTQGYGGKVQRSTSAGGDVFEDIMYIVDLPDMTFSREEIDVTHTQSPGLWKETLPDAVRMIEDLSFTILDSPGLTSHQHIYDDFATNWGYGQMSTYRVTEPEGTVLIEFKGWVKSISPQRKRGEAKLREVTLTVTGQPTTVNL